MYLYVFSCVLFFLFVFFLFCFFPFSKLCVRFFDFFFLGFKLNFCYSSVIFSIILLFVSVSVLVYSCYYLNGEINFYYYMFVLLVFICSIFFLILSNGLLSIMVSWDLLGISSFFLVLFYNNWDSCSGSINTVITNRLGDFFMFVFFSLSFFNYIYFYRYSFVCFGFLLFLVLSAFTKSAQFPFSGWLPKAMSAPTPVSSLVHSSTLVTAGLVLLLNFNLLIFSSSVMFLLCFFGVFTMFFSSICALYECDLKKVVALSTLSQMGFSILTLGLGLHFVSLLHLLSHALFKSCLFIQVGYIIHCSFGQQDGRNYNGMCGLPHFIQLQLLITLFCLCGLFFTSGSVSKDFIIFLFFSNTFSFVFSLFFFISVFFTFCYSYRIWFRLFSSSSSSLFFYSGSFLINFISVLLVVFSVCFIWWLNLNILSIPSLFLYLDFYIPLFFLFVFGFFFKFSFKFVSYELKYKFLVDFFPRFLLFFILNNKVVDLFLNKLNHYLIGVFSLFSRNSIIVMRSPFRIFVFFIMFVFVLIWAFSIFEYI